MARLNELATEDGGGGAQGGGGGGGAISRADFSAYRRRWLQQNAEVVRLNAAQGVRIRTLEQETTRLLTENIELREQVIRLEAESGRRDRNKQIVENIGMTQKKLEQKMKEVNELIKDLTRIPGVQSAAKKKAVTPALEQRLMRSSYVPGELPEGYLPAIDEDRRASLGEWRRSSLNFDEIQLPPSSSSHPALFMESENSDSEQEVTKEPCYFESRPRQRRDSSAVQDIIQEGNRAIKHKFTEKDDCPNPPSSPPGLDFRFSKVSQKAANLAKRQLEVEKTRSSRKSLPIDNDDDEVIVDEPERVRSPPATQRPTSTSTHRRSASTGSIPTTNTTTTSSGRRALGPKSANTDPSNSPVKPASLEKDKPDYGSTKSIRNSTTRDKDTPPPETDPASTVRSARRARNPVSYAEPSLRAKMRREETGLVDAVKGEGKTRRLTVAEAAAAKKAAKVKEEETSKEKEMVKIKTEEPEDEDQARWLDLPPPPQGDLVKKSPSPEGERTSSPTNVIHRKRRTSALITALSSEDATAAEPRKRIDIYQSPPPSSDGKSRSGSVDQLRKTTIGPELPLRRARRSTLSVDDVKKVPKARSTTALGSSTGEGGENMVATRRRSMVL